MDPVGLPVPLPRVEAALAEFWKNEQALTKASLINLLILSPEAGSLLPNNDLVSELTRDHACRVLLAEAPSEGPPVETRAWITAHCHLAGGRKSVCSEQVAFVLDGRTPGLVRNTLLAHLLSDLPVVCWWQGHPGPLFEPSLLRFIDRLIIDSAAFRPGDVESEVRRILAVQSSLAQPFSLHDLAWTRSYQTRQALAALFDHPQAAARLSEVRKVRIEAPGGDFVSALFLGAWIAHTLGWTFDGCTRHHSRWHSASGEVDLHFHRADPGSPALRLEMEAPQARASVGPTPDGAHVEARATDGGGEISTLVPGSKSDVASLVGGVISRAGRNTLYQAILPAFLQLAGPCADCTGCLE